MSCKLGRYNTNKCRKKIRTQINESATLRFICSSGGGDGKKKPRRNLDMGLPMICMYVAYESRGSVTESDVSNESGSGFSWIESNM